MKKKVVKWILLIVFVIYPVYRISFPIIFPEQFGPIFWKDGSVKTENVIEAAQEESFIQEYMIANVKTIDSSYIFPSIGHIWTEYYRSLKHGIFRTKIIQKSEYKLRFEIYDADTVVCKNQYRKLWALRESAETVALFPLGFGQNMEHCWQLSQNIPMTIGMWFSNHSLNEVVNFTVDRYTGKSIDDRVPVATFDMCR